jgi:hypothetical protein
MKHTTINDLFTAYSDGCGSAGPTLSRDALQDDFHDWCRARGVEPRYEVQGRAYLEAPDGAHSAAAESDDAREVDEATVATLLRHIELSWLSVTLDRDDPEEGAGDAYWVKALVEGLGHEVRVRLYAARGSPRGNLVPCGEALDDWCDLELRTLYGDVMANAIAREVLARAGNVL